MDNLAQLVSERFVIPHVYGSDEQPTEPAFHGYWRGERVSGWAVAYFTKDEGLRIVECSLAAMASVPYYRGRYSAETDAFIFDDGLNPLEIYPGEDHVVNGREVRLYNIGGRGRWIWANRFPIRRQAVAEAACGASSLDAALAA